MSIQRVSGTMETLRTLEVKHGEIDSPAAALLLAEQQVRGHLVNPYLTATADDHAINLRLQVAFSRAKHKISVYDSLGSLRGFACMAEHSLAPDNLRRLFIGSQGLHSLEFVVPKPSEPDADAVAYSLSDAITSLTQKTICLSVPIGSAWCEPSLNRTGFQNAGVESLRPPMKLSRYVRACGTDTKIRRATRDDIDEIVELMAEEYTYLSQFHPVAKSLWSKAEFEPALRGHLANGVDDSENAIILVAEVDQTVAGMVYMRTRRIADPTNPLPTGLHVVIDDISVKANVQGRGIGRSLIEATYDAFRTDHVAAFGLEYTADNPIARRLWPHLGFRAHRRSYVRTA